MRVRKKYPQTTHEGAPVSRLKIIDQLRRTVSACLLWEKSFYEDGESIADRVFDLATRCRQPQDVEDLAIYARNELHLRHTPLWVAVALAKKGKLNGRLVLDAIIQRPDELVEFLELYWKDGRCPLSAQVKKGLAMAFTKFDEYQLSKYNRKGSVQLRDVMFLTHPKPRTTEQAQVWEKLANGKLEPPDTWESAMASGKDALATFTDLLKRKKLGAMALLRNLRKMDEVGVDDDLVGSALLEANYRRVLPFRFIAAMKHSVKWEEVLDNMLAAKLAGMDKLPGDTAVLVDVSGSMTSPLSARSDMDRIDAATGMAVCLREMCERPKFWSFSMYLERVPSRRGMSLRDAITSSQPHSGTYLGRALMDLYDYKSNRAITRIVVITDEQSYDRIPDPPPGVLPYIINVASYKNGVGYGKWVHVNGFSEAVLDWMLAYEATL